MLQTNKYIEHHMGIRLTVVRPEGMGMVFGIGKRDARDTQETHGSKRIPYKLASYEHDHEGKKFKSSNVVYSFWSASKYVLILSVMLWWLPMFGQMIAGYVGGRRAGGPWKGVAASILPVVCLYGVITGFETGVLPSHVFGIAIAPAAVSAALSTSVPFISPYIQFSSEYVGAFVDSLAGGSPYGINTYVLTVAFAYVGGVLAEQNRREIEFSSGAVVSSTTVLVADRQDYALPESSSHPHHHGLTSTLAHMLPWAHRESDQSRAMAATVRRDWAAAADVRYEDYAGAVVRPYVVPQTRVLNDSTFSQAHAHRRPHRRPMQVPRLPPHRSDPWVRADRRLRQTYSSARRFSQYDGYDESPRREYQMPDRRHHSQRRHEPVRITPGDPRSIKRARKEIENEWGRREYPSLVEEHSVHEASTGNNPRQEHQRRRQSQAEQWEAI